MGDGVDVDGVDVGVDTVDGWCEPSSELHHGRRWSCEERLI